MSSGPQSCNPFIRLCTGSGTKSDLLSPLSLDIAHGLKNISFQYLLLISLYLSTNNRITDAEIVGDKH